MNPSKVDIAMSMLEREAVNIAGKFGFADHPLLKLGMEYTKLTYGDKIKAVLASMVQSDASMEAGSEVLKESMATCIDGFSERLKQKLNTQGETSGQDTP